MDSKTKHGNIKKMRGKVNGGEGWWFAFLYITAIKYFTHFLFTFQGYNSVHKQNKEFQWS
jgi:hypothetical protein